MTIKHYFIALFVILISLPTLLMGLQKETGDYENRAKQQFPKMSWKHPFTTFKKWEAYYKDNFMFRDELSNFYFTLKEDYFKTDPLPSKVVSGKNGWLFLGDSYSDVFSESVGITPITAREVEQAAEKIIKMKEFCESRNIRFYFAVAPNKESFYSEFLPLPPNNKPRKLELLKGYLHANYNFDIIDLKEYLEPLKTKIKLFNKTDTHWNEYGAFLGTQHLVDVIHKDFPVEPLKFKDFKIDTFYSDEMDLSKMIKKRIPEQRFRFTTALINEVDTDTILVENKSNTYLLKTTSKAGKGLKALVFRDSFFSWMVDYFSITVEHSTITKKKFDEEMIEEERPNFVVVEIVERNL